MEDRVAAIFLKSLIVHLDHELMRHFSLAYAQNGASGIRRALAEVEHAMRPPTCVVIGIIDGDERVPTAPEEPQLVGFLPGNEAPEEIIRNVLNEWRVESEKSWIPPLAGGASVLEMELERVDGLDHHDWLTDLAKRYGELETFVMIVTELVLMRSDLRENAVTLLSWIRGLIQS